MLAVPLEAQHAFLLLELVRKTCAKFRLPRRIQERGNLRLVAIEHNEAHQPLPLYSISAARLPNGRTPD